MALIIDMKTREKFDPETMNLIYLGKQDKDYLSIIKCWDSCYEYFQLLPQRKSMDEYERFEDLAKRIVDRQIGILMIDDPLRKYRLINGVPDNVLNRIKTMMIDCKYYDSLEKWGEQEHQIFSQIFHKEYSLLEERLSHTRRAPN